MKIGISYDAAESEVANKIADAVRRIVPNTRTHQSKSEAKGGFFHIYLTSKKPEKPRNIKDFS